MIIAIILIIILITIRGKYKEALDVTANLQGSMDGLKAEIDAMGKQLAEEQGNISVYTDRQTKATATKAQAESELKAAQAVLSDEESSRVALAAEVKAHSGSIGVVKKEIEDIELAIAKVELEKGNRDHTIKVLQDEIAEQDEVINKLNKEKKHIAENQAKSNDDMISANEKVDHLASVKSKLESTLGELESSLDKEKKSRATVEKQKRKVEGDLKMAQDGVVELERSKRDLEVTIGNKEKNNAQLAAKLDDEQNLVAKAQKVRLHFVAFVFTRIRCEVKGKQHKEAMSCKYHLILFYIRESRRSRAELRPWKRNLRRNVRLVRRPRGRGLTWRGRSTSWVSVWTKPAVPPLLRWNSTRRGRPRSTSSEKTSRRPTSNKSLSSPTSRESRAMLPLR